MTAFNRVRIFVTSDTHGYLLGTEFDTQEPVTEDDLGRLMSGLIPIKHLLADRNRDASLVIDNGDTMLGSKTQQFLRQRANDSRSNNSQGENRSLVTKTLKAIDYDAFIPGNHDFDEGIETLLEFAESWNGPLVLANIALDEDHPLAERAAQHIRPYAIFQTNDIRIGIVGILTRAIHEMNPEETLSGVKFLDPVPVLQEILRTLKEQVDVVIVSYHGGVDWDENTFEQLRVPPEKLLNENEAYRILTEVDGIDALVTGHQHRVLSGKFDGKVPYLQVGYGGSHIGEIIIEQEVTGAKRIQVKTIPVSQTLRELRKTLTDEEIRELLQLHQEYREWSTSPTTQFGKQR